MILAALAGAGPAGAQTVTCRPTALGAVACPGPVRPKPRPETPGAPSVQALDRVRDAAPPSGDETTFVPARRARALGGTVFTDAPGRCRADTLGNLRCR